MSGQLRGSDGTNIYTFFDGVTFTLHPDGTMTAPSSEIGAGIGCAAFFSRAFGQPVTENSSNAANLIVENTGNDMSCTNFPGTIWSIDSSSGNLKVAYTNPPGSTDTYETTQFYLAYLNIAPPPSGILFISGQPEANIPPQGGVIDLGTLLTHDIRRTFLFFIDLRDANCDCKEPSESSSQVEREPHPSF
ncbi:hypothetical protein FRB99_007621 [Tulasnella sp. 403]|nr:hypothetical protein FRB99_007621 [Tulasnella sp. 403]